MATFSFSATYGKHKNYESPDAIIKSIFDPVKSVYSGSMDISCENVLPLGKGFCSPLFCSETHWLIQHFVLMFDRESFVTPDYADYLVNLIILPFFARQYQIVYSVHDNTDTLHVHFLMNRIPLSDGTIFKANDKTLSEFRRYVNRFMPIPISMAIPCASLMYGHEGAATIRRKPAYVVLRRAKR